MAKRYPTPAEFGSAPASHVGSTEGHPVATEAAPGFQSAADKAKINTALEDFTNEARNVIFLGGGTISWGVVASKFKWTARFLLMPVSDNVSSSSFVSLGMPTAGVTDAAGVERASVDGIALKPWESLWLIHTRGFTSGEGNSWKVLHYIDDPLIATYFDDENAYLIATRNGDNGSLYIRNGLVVQTGRTIEPGQGAMFPTWTQVTSKPDTFTPTDDSVSAAKMAAANKGVVICTSTTRPASPVKGQHIYETDTDATLKNTGTPAEPVWTALGGGGGGAVAADAPLEGDGTTTNHLRIPAATASAAGHMTAAAQAKLDGYVSVKDFGAVGDGVTDDSGAFNSALQYLDNQGGGILHVPPGEYMAPNIVLPGTTTTVYKILGIVGYGATLKSNAGSPIISRPLPPSTSEQGGFLNYRFLVEGLRFEGDGVTAGQKALFLPCTYGSQIINCASLSMDIGFDLVFALMNRVEGCFDRSSRTRGFVARSAAGLYTGATVNSSGSNQTVFRNCRSYGEAGMEAQFYVSASSGVQMEGCVTEGFNPIDSVVYDYAGSNSKLFTVRNHHAENTPTNSVFRIISAGRTYLEKIFRGDLPVTNLVDVTGSLNVSAIHLVNWPWLSANGKFKHDPSTNPVWRTDELGPALPKDLFDPQYWDGGVVPLTLRVQDNRGLKSVSISSGPLILSAAQANYVGISATGNFYFGTPTQVNRGLILTLDIKNDSAGTIGIGWPAVFLRAGDFVPPVAGKRKIISFYYDGSNWVETYRSATDI